VRKNRHKLSLVGYVIIGRLVEFNTLELEHLTIYPLKLRGKSVKHPFGDILSRRNKIHLRVFEGLFFDEIEHDIASTSYVPMIELAIDERFDNTLDIPEIDHHPLVTRSLILDDITLNGDLRTIPMPMDIAALTRMIRDPMPHVPFDDSCDLHDCLTL